MQREGAQASCRLCSGFYSRKPAVMWTQKDFCVAASTLLHCSETHEGWRKETQSCGAKEAKDSSSVKHLWSVWFDLLTWKLKKEKLWKHIHPLCEQILDPSITDLKLRPPQLVVEEQLASRWLTVSINRDQNDQCSQSLLFSCRLLAWILKISFLLQHKVPGKMKDSGFPWTASLAATSCSAACSPLISQSAVKTT